MTYRLTQGEAVGILYSWLYEYGLPGVNMNASGNSPAEIVERWYAEELRQAQAQALEEAAEAWENGTVDYFEIKHSSDAPLGWSDESVADAIMSSGPVMDWLRKRAKQIKDQQ